MTNLIQFPATRITTATRTDNFARKVIERENRAYDYSTQGRQVYCPMWGRVIRVPHEQN